MQKAWRKKRWKRKGQHEETANEANSINSPSIQPRSRESPSASPKPPRGWAVVDEENRRRVSGEDSGRVELRERETHVIGLESLESTGEVNKELLHLESGESDGDGLSEERLSKTTGRSSAELRGTRRATVVLRCL